ncbi:MAG TPA: hypothetical protein VN901_17035 [Candidatus Acidoferrales bacterium]|nr:hypothetical protein [Candidatus Acidoferrales bacterium]
MAKAGELAMHHGPWGLPAVFAASLYADDCNVYVGSERAGLGLGRIHKPAEDQTQQSIRAGHHTITVVYPNCTNRNRKQSRTSRALETRVA